MPKNKLQDLNDHLFAQLERLGQEGMKPKDLEAECRRADAMVAVADRIAEGYNIRLRAAALYGQHGRNILPLLPAGDLGAAGLPRPPEENQG